MGTIVHVFHARRDGITSKQQCILGKRLLSELLRWLDPETEGEFIPMISWAVPESGVHY